MRAPSSEYRWEVLNPLGPPDKFKYQLCPEIDTSGDDVQVPDHFELLYRSDSHYDGVMALSGGVSAIRPLLKAAYYDCRRITIE